MDGRDRFLLDIWRSAKNVRRARFQIRAKRAVVLARLGIGGAAHRNPDESEVPAPHLHLYRRGWGDGWANPVPIARFTAPNDLYRSLEEFMAYCNITVAPKIQWDLL